MRFPNMGEEQNIEGRFLGLTLWDTSSSRRCLPSIIMYDLQAELTGCESFSLHRLVLGLRHLPKNRPRKSLKKYKFTGWPKRAIFINYICFRKYVLEMTRKRRVFLQEKLLIFGIWKKNLADAILQQFNIHFAVIQRVFRNLWIRYQHVYYVCHKGFFVFILNLDLHLWPTEITWNYPELQLVFHRIYLWHFKAFFCHL